MALKFNNGDRLRVTDGCCSHRTGHMGTVDRYDASGVYQFVNDMTELGTHPLSGFEHKFEPIEQAMPVVDATSEIKAGAEHSLLPDAKFWTSTNGGGLFGGVFFEPGVTRVKVIEKSVYTPEKGNWEVEAVNGPDYPKFQTVHESFLVPLDAPFVEAPKVSPQERLIQDQQNEMLKLQDMLRSAERRHKDDIEFLGERLIRAADENDLCEQFDNFVVRVNENLKFSLPEREKEYMVEVQFTQTLYVTARNADEAEELALDHDEYGSVGSDDQTDISVEVNDNY